jgi:phosphoribosyl-ATP pyrophosphohydrolase/phosphoribosyl-AMP cyclohydrolase
MLAFMNAEAFEKSKVGGRATFYSRSRQQLWTKGETSGHYLDVKDIILDCDQDTVLLKVTPHGPVCHTGQDTCFNERNETAELSFLERTIQERKNHPRKGSYTNRLFDEGINKIAQKVGEEAVELVLEAKDNNRDRLLNEAADLMYHFLVLLAAKDVTLDDVTQVLKSRRS